MTDTPSGANATRIPNPAAEAAAARPSAVRSRSEGLPTRTRRALQRAGELIEKGRADEADQALAGVATDHPEVQRVLGIVRHLQQRHADAIGLLRRAATQLPHDALILNNLGTALRGAGDLQAAESTFLRACEVDPKLAAAWFNLGITYTAQLDVGRAAEAFGRALACDPRHLRARISYADALLQLGRLDEVAAHYRAGIAQDPGNVHNWVGLANINTLRFTADDVVALEQLVDASSDPEQRVGARFVLARALEDQNRYGEAFTALSLANAAKRRQLEWDAGAFSRHVDAIMAAFAKPPTPARDPSLGREVIFIVSLPRSGSTLVEQIVSSHSDVEGANELSALGDVFQGESRRRGVDFTQWAAQATPQDWQRLGKEYLAQTARWRKNHRVFTDKALGNWRYVGAALAMLPGARFINCRRDPVETSLSCYRQTFGKGHAYSYDIAEMAAYWHDYDRLTRFWAARYPHRMLDVMHEQLLDDPETEIRRILDFCELPFEPACMRFHDSQRTVRTLSAAQVRQPLRRSTARASGYAELLSPLRWALGVEQAFAD